LLWALVFFNAELADLLLWVGCARSDLTQLNAALMLLWLLLLLIVHAAVPPGWSLLLFFPSPVFSAVVGLAADGPPAAQ
jgi:hypothetical protein